MSIWNRFIGLINAEDSISNKKISVQYNALHYAIVDVEIGLEDYKLGHFAMMVQYIIKFRKRNFLNFLVTWTIFVVTISFIMMPNICSRIKHVVGF